jgi:hypothetical protein
MENAVPVGVRIDFPGATLEWYDKAIATAGFLPGGPLVNQAFSHWVTETDNGICIVEVWESREAFENNADEKGERIVRRLAFRAHQPSSSSRFTTTFPVGHRGPNHQSEPGVPTPSPGSSFVNWPL